jgi:DNA ligase-1
MLFSEVVAVSAEVAGTRSRLAKRAAIAGLLRRAAADDVEVVVAFLAGELRQRRTGVGWAAITQIPAAADQPTLELAEVDATFERISRLAGPGSAGARASAVGSLFARATADEQLFLRGLVSGAVRQGALDGVMLDALADASAVPAALVRRAVMLRGAIGPVAAAALGGGAEAVAAFGLRVGQPVKPMLASSAPDVDGAFERLGPGAHAFDAKLDGIRIQVHRDGDAVRIYTRSLDDITDRLGEIAAVTRTLPARRLVLDGEAITLDRGGRPRPFQETASRTATQAPTGATVTPYFFDMLHADGTDLLDEPLRTRLRRLDEVAGRYVVPRLVTADPAAARAFFEATVAAGQEGVVAKALDAPYEAGRRGAGWVKVKPRHTLDLVVLAVEWGSGRRQGWLSNIHLGARDPADGGFVMLGKTFKGMTDEMLAWQTERFLELETSREGHVVRLRPEQVVEIAFDGLQRSTRYPGGVALRFARVLRYRADKAAAEADTIDTVRSIARMTAPDPVPDDRSTPPATAAGRGQPDAPTDRQ